MSEHSRSARGREAGISAEQFDEIDDHKSDQEGDDRRAENGVVPTLE